MRIAARFTAAVLFLASAAPLLAAVHRERVPVPLAPAVAEALAVKSSPKIEAGLALALRDPSFRERISRVYKTASSTRPFTPFAVEQAENGSTLLPLFIESRDVEATKRAVAALHGSVSSVVKRHVVAHVPVDAVEALAAGDDVVRIEPSYFAHSSLDVSRAEVGADKVQSGSGGLASPFTGKGVVVGVLDTGIDWSHPDFKDASGKTRISSLWDLTQDGKPPSGTAKGFECKSTDIDGGTCPERDTNGHGTHVAGIAAGNGRARGSTFTGMAPEADLIIVKGGNGGFSQTNIVDGVSYIFRSAGTLGKPAVVNLSLGGHSGPHDGTSAYEQSLSNMLGAGKLICVANGNEGGDRIHLGYDARGTSYATGISTYWNVDKGESQSLIDVWYSGTISAGIVANVTSGGKLVGVFTTPPVPTGSQLDRTKVTAAGSTIGFVTIGTETTSLGQKHMVVVIDNDDDSSIDLSQVTWEFFSFGSGHIDAWVTTGGSFDDFDDPTKGYRAGDMNMTVGMPATATNMIAVGSYTTKTSWVDVDGNNRKYASQKTIGQISTFSSLGPTRDGRQRPIVSAPGEGIVSVLSSAVDTSATSLRPFLISGGSYMLEQGTSQATPHVTGIVALMLQAKKDLAVTDAYSILRGNARKDSFTGSTANNVYGDGKVDALAYVKQTTGLGVGPTVCTASPTTLCLSGNRFAVSVQWKTPDNATGQGQAVSLGADTGYFTFFQATNVEMVIKVLNACSFAQRFWVFAGGLTNVEVTMTVIDTKTGSVKTYTNPQNTAFQPIQDTNAFATCP